MLKLRLFYFHIFFSNNFFIKIGKVFSYLLDILSEFNVFIRIILKNQTNISIIHNQIINIFIINIVSIIIKVLTLR